MIRPSMAHAGIRTARDTPGMPPSVRIASKYLLALVALLAASGCGSEPRIGVGRGGSLEQGVHDAYDAAPPSDAPVDGVVAPEASTPPASADAGEPDAGSYPIALRWTGKYVFDELPVGCPQCLRYRVIVDACPGPCTVRVDVDGRQTKRRLEGIGRTTHSREELAVRFTGYRDDDALRSGLPLDSVLLTLEALPGSLLLLRFGALGSSNGSASLIVRRGPMQVVDPARAP